MYIKKIAIGDLNEAFIEDRLKNGFNIIYSNDNNKGKTIVVQSCFYALGNEPFFPGSFEYKNYYHIVDLILDNGKELMVCRKDKSFICIYEQNITFYENVSEFKRFIDKVGIKLPYINKDDKLKMIDPVLLFEMFFVRQDSRKTSNVIGSSYYNKRDFINMLFSLNGLGESAYDKINIDEAKGKIKALKLEQRNIKKEFKILSINNDVSCMVYDAMEKERFNEKIQQTTKIKDSITDLVNEKNKFLNKIYHVDMILKELNSLNKTIKSGTLKCMDCGSHHISFADEEDNFTFDISSKTMRANIISAYNEKKDQYNDEIDHCDIEISKLQQKLNELLSDKEINIEKLLLFKPELIDAEKGAERLKEIPKEIEELENTIKAQSESSKDTIEKQKELLANIEKEMNIFFHKLETNDNTIISLFTNNTMACSGCESVEFYLSRIYALAIILKHNYFIVVDCFRDGELSSEREAIVLEEFKKLHNQIIFTATVKNEEYERFKSINDINTLDYSSIENRHLLNSSNINEFKTFLRMFSLNIE